MSLILKNIEDKIIEINKFIKTRYNKNSKDKIYAKPEFFWCLNEDIEDIAKEIVKQILDIENKKVQKFEKINIVDFFSGSTILTLNIVKNLIDKKIEIDEIFFNDIINTTEINIINNIQIKNYQKIKYTSILINEDNISSELNNFLKKDEKTLNLIICNPLIGDKGFKKFNVNEPEKFIIHKINQEIKNNNFNNSVLIFISKNKDKIFLEEETTIVNIENIEYDLTEEQKNIINISNIIEDKIEDKIENKIENLFYKNKNKYNVFINCLFLGNKNKGILYNLFFDGKNILNVNSKKTKEEKINNIFNINYSLEKIINKYNNLKVDL